MKYSVLTVSLSKSIHQGFTLVELMIVVAILGVLASIAIPSYADMMAEQRVRSIASDLMSDLVLARVEAIKQQRRVVVVHAGATWKEGWSIVVVGGGPGGADLEIKRPSAYGTSTTKLCAMTVDFDAQIVFRGDGSVGNAPIGAESGLRVSDDKGSGSSAGARSRNIAISPAGRASVEILPVGSGVVC